MKIETSDIYRSLRQLLEKTFPDITVQIKDIKNPLPPCFYIKYVTDTSLQIATEYSNDSYVFDVIYFSEHQTLQDLTSKEKILKRIFSKPLQIGIDNSVQYQEITSSPPIFFILPLVSYSTRLPPILRILSSVNAGSEVTKNIKNNIKNRNCFILIPCFKHYNSYLK